MSKRVRAAGGMRANAEEARRYERRPRVPLDEIYSVHCPYCGAQEQSWCENLRMIGITRKAPHPQRRENALQMRGIDEFKRG